MRYARKSEDTEQMAGHFLGALEYPDVPGTENGCIIARMAEAETAWKRQS